jgi:small subunit ribosomal protein S20
MANIKSAIKRIRTAETARLRNKNRISRIRTFIKKVDAAITTGDATAAQTALRELQPEIARGSVKGAMHKNTAARTVSRLAARIKALSTKAA